MVKRSELLKRTKKEIEPTALILCIIMTLAGLFLFYLGTLALATHYRHTSLLKSGIRTEGIVVAKKEQKQKLRELFFNFFKPPFEVTLRYTTLEGDKVEAIAGCIKREFQEVSIGDTVPLLYAAKNPQVVTIMFSQIHMFVITMMLYPIAALGVVFFWFIRSLYVKNKLYLYEHGIKSTGIVKKYDSGFGFHRVLFEVKSKGRKYRVSDCVSKEDFKHILVGGIGGTIKVLVHPKKYKKSIYLPEDLIGKLNSIES